MSQYEVIALIEFQGSLTRSGHSVGHYICDIKDESSGKWFRTSDSNAPVQIEEEDVTQLSYVIQYRKVKDY